MATLWGIPASLFANTIWKGVSAGTSRLSVSKAIPDAVIFRVTVSPPGASLGAVVGAPEGPGVALPPPPPKASFQQAGTGVAPAGIV